jgi:hypothetical protein
MTVLGTLTVSVGILKEMTLLPVLHQPAQALQGPLFLFTNILGPLQVASAHPLVS